jgi:hypothetical protein
MAVLGRDIGAPQNVHSGVLVAEPIELEACSENRGAQFLREVVSRASGMVVDGTTIATVLAHAMIQERQRDLAGGLNPQVRKRGMVQASDVIVQTLNERAHPCAGSQEIDQAASIFASNDGSIGELMATLMINAERGTLKTCAGQAPGWVDRGQAMQHDVAVLPCCARAVRWPTLRAPILAPIGASASSHRRGKGRCVALCARQAMSPLRCCSAWTKPATLLATTTRLQEAASTCCGGAR